MKNLSPKERITLQQKRRRLSLGLSEDFDTIDRSQVLAGIQKETCDFWNDTTGIDDYEDVLNNVEPRKFSNLNGEIIYMNPEEFISECDKLRGDFSSYADAKDITEVFYEVYMSEFFKKEIEKGATFSIPYLDYVNKKGSERKNLAFGAKLFGCPKIPVAVFTEK